jgi:hypothetical protein
VENSWYGGPTTKEATQIESLEESLRSYKCFGGKQNFGGLHEAEPAVAENRAASELPTEELARYDFQLNHDLDSRFT